MATDATCLEVFTEGVVQLLAPLTDEIDDKVASTIIRFALQAVGTDVVRLQSLVDAIYNKATHHDDCSARLFVKLWKLVPVTIGATLKMRQGNVAAKGAKLVRSYLLKNCQRDLDLGMTTQVWPTKPITVLLAMWQAGLKGPVSVVRHILEEMAESEHLFEHQNFDNFAHICIACGPVLDQDIKDDTLTKCFNKLSARVTSKSIGHKLMVAGLVATRENLWEIELEAVPRVLTPAESEFEVEMEVIVKTEPSTEI